MNMNLLSPQDHKFPSLVAKVALKSKRKLIDNLLYQVLFGIKIKLWATYLSLLSGLIHWASRIIRPTSNWQRPLFRQSGHTKKSSHSRKRSSEYLMKMNECKRTISALGILIFFYSFSTCALRPPSVCSPPRPLWSTLGSSAPSTNGFTAFWLK